MALISLYIVILKYPIAAMEIILSSLYAGSKNGTIKFAKHGKIRRDLEACRWVFGDLRSEPKGSLLESDC